MILILSDESDVHREYVCRKLDERGVEWVLFDTSKFPENLSVGLLAGNSGHEVLLEIGDKVISSAEIKSVWNRRRPPTALGDSLKTDAVREYIKRESGIYLSSLHQILGGFWLSNPDATETASRKPLQLITAAKLGIKIPDTCVGNSLAAANQFIKDRDGFALKAVGMAAVEIDSESTGVDCLRLYTSQISRADLEPALPQLKNSPVILQPYIPKAFELRITVVGTRVFSCAIYSQVTERTKEDWRRYDLENTPHEIYELPKPIEQQCLDIVRELGLVFGCIDMIVTPEGEYIFLEINPNGQWLWIEHITGMPIGDQLVEMLIAGHI